MFGREKALHKNNETLSQLESMLEEVRKKKNPFLVISAEILLFPKRVRRQIVRRVKVNKHQPLIK